MSPQVERRRAVRRLELRRVHEEVRAKVFGAAPAPVLVGRFVLRRRVGAGATGVVYAARDPELDREVAVKLVIADLDELAEARALARMSHPNLLPVYEVGVHDGVPFIVSELVEGGSLRAWLAAPRTAAERLDVVLAAARGIAEAHRRGIVHRDLKPDNILVGGDGRPRVADFGLSRRLDEAHDGPQPGTPAYMAPEQRAGERADPRSDQYSFAVLAYEVLFGAYPSMHDRAEGPGDHAAWPALARALAPLPEARWPSMDALVEALAPPAARPAPSRAWIYALVALAVIVAAVAIEVIVRRPRDGGGRARTPTEIDDALLLEAGPMMMAQRFEDCAAHLAGRVRTDAGRHVWVSCAEHAGADALAAACAAWRGASPGTVPAECDLDVAKLRALADAGDYRACADFGLTLEENTIPVRLLLSRCVGAIHEPRYHIALCKWEKRLKGDPAWETSCGYEVK